MRSRTAGSASFTIKPRPVASGPDADLRRPRGPFFRRCRVWAEKIRTRASLSFRASRRRFGFPPQPARRTPEPEPRKARKSSLKSFSETGVARSRHADALGGEIGGLPNALVAVVLGGMHQGGISGLRCRPGVGQGLGRCACGRCFPCPARPSPGGHAVVEPYTSPRTVTVLQRMRSSGAGQGLGQVFPLQQGRDVSQHDRARGRPAAPPPSSPPPDPAPSEAPPQQGRAERPRQNAGHDQALQADGGPGDGKPRSPRPREAAPTAEHRRRGRSPTL